MRKLILLIGLLCISATSFTQTTSSKEDLKELAIDQKRDSLQKIYLDTLVKFVRKNFYANDFATTIEWGQVGLKKANELDYSKAKFRISSLLGNAFLKVDDTLQAKRIFEEALREAETKHDSSRSKISAIIDMGNFYALQELSTPAIEWYQEAIPLAKKFEDTTYLYILHYNVGELYLNDEEASNAVYYVDKTQDYVANLRTPYQAGAKLLLGRYQYLIKDYDKATLNLKESIELSKEANFTDGVIQGYDLYARAAAAQGNYQLAYKLREEGEEFKEEKYQTDKIEAVEVATARFKIDQYEQELKAQTLQNEIDRADTKRKTTLLWVKIAGGILFVFFVFMFVSFIRRKKLLKSLIFKNQQYLEAKEQTERLARAKTELFSNITHELRTPMYGIIGTANLMIKEDQPVEQKESLRSLKFSANYLLSLINNVLQLTKIETGRHEGLSKNKFNIIQLVEDVVDSCKYINEKNPNTYELSFDKSLPHILIGDDLKLSQILMNLVGNASKFTQDGKISISLNVIDKKEESVEIAFIIEDTGIGIAEEHQKDIFNEFTQSYISRVTEGAGLGLPIVKKLLDLHHAEISIESEVGRGTKIEFSISYAYDSVHQNTPDKFLKDNYPLKGLHILVVDDNKINQIVTKKTLETYGAEITKCGSGPEAIELVSKLDLDLILMDINMPGMNGFEATKEIRKTHAQLPILALTAVELEKVIGDHSYELMNGCVIKPFKNDILIDTILKHINTTF